jgi:hypothetical protein
MEKYWELGIDEWVSYMYIYHDENKLFSMKWSCGFVLDQRAEMVASPQAALRSKSKDWLARNQNNVSEWSDMFTHGLLFQWASTIQIHVYILNFVISGLTIWDVDTIFGDLGVNVYQS